MAIDNPMSALNTQTKLEESSAVPFGGLLLALLSAVTGGSLPVQLLETLRAKDEQHRVSVFIDTLGEEINRLDAKVAEILEKLSPVEQEQAALVIIGLITDATRKAAAIRSEERIKRIAAILAHGLAALEAEEVDQIDEMMRVAMDLTDYEVDCLSKLVGMEGSIVKVHGRISRYDAHQQWESSDFKSKNDPEVEGAFAKLESYGLVWRIPSQNNMNVMADIMNGYALLPKGLRFVELITTQK